MNLAQEVRIEKSVYAFNYFMTCILHSSNTCIKPKKTYKEQVKPRSQGTIHYYLLVKHNIHSRGAGFQRSQIIFNVRM